MQRYLVNMVHGGDAGSHTAAALCPAGAVQPKVDRTAYSRTCVSAAACSSKILNGRYSACCIIILLIKLLFWRRLWWSSLHRQCRMVCGLATLAPLATFRTRCSRWCCPTWALPKSSFLPLQSARAFGRCSSGSNSGQASASRCRKGGIILVRA